VRAPLSCGGLANGLQRNRQLRACRVGRGVGAAGGVGAAPVTRRPVEVAGARRLFGGYAPITPNVARWEEGRVRSNAVQKVGRL